MISIWVTAVTRLTDTRSEGTDGHLTDSTRFRMRVFALLVLVAVADALAFRPARRARDDKSVLRLAQDEPIPEGWRLATASDAECNRVCFGLVLRPRGWRRKRDEADLASNLKVSAPDSRNAFASASVRVEQRTPQEEKCAYKVAVRFKESKVLKREHTERVLSRVQRICGYYILAFSITSISPLLASHPILSGIFLAAIYVYMPVVLRNEWIRRRGSV